MSLRSIQSLYSGARIPIRTFSSTVNRFQQQPPQPSSQAQAQAQNQAQGQAQAQAQAQAQTKPKLDGVDAVSGRPLIPNKKHEDPQNSNSNVRSFSYPIPSDLGLQLPKMDARLERLRVVPSLQTFYGGNPGHDYTMNRLNQVVRKYINLPTKVSDAKTQKEQKRFINFEEYKEKIGGGTRLKPLHHKDLTTVLQRLRSIEPQLMPEEVQTVLNEFTYVGGSESQRAKVLKTLDEFGRSLSHGRRKTSKARVYLVKGEGEIIINGRSFMDYFPYDKHRSRINYPFVTVAQEGQYNVFVEVVGGGIGGQCEAIMYGIAKGLIIHNPLLKSRLSAAGLMTRDARKVERKKPGKLKARKMPAWVKR
ncbi:37S ribosomal protein S9, mitochondrial [[Candida] railenensis]|uniref:Small ribosomal subunit protein uS9m n=1 Tax=[Candida] railenensis TaxID=45579 RepID=A0A9P0QPC3_9ASCO|nr:37S ribosomal protein S9, mitochondrial [[Candida] railenensis]